MSIKLQRLHHGSSSFEADFESLLAAEAGWELTLENDVRAIIDEVRSRGDEALVEYTRRFDNWTVSGPEQLELPPARIEQAWEAIAPEQREALSAAARRVSAFHEHQRQDSWTYEEPDGTVLGQQVTPLDRAGIYVPGGQAAYPSTVLMNAIPAKVAGVKEIIMVVPTPGGLVNDLVLAAARVAGVSRVFAVGGAQAVAALAFGTRSVPRVDKIVGPGNVYVATAKRLVFGAVGIDMIAGPSEIVILCDGSVRPDWIAMDLFSQAEHDEDARAVALCPDREYLDQVAAEVERLLPTMPREAIIRESLAARGALIEVADLSHGVELVNRLAPEHLELAVAAPDDLLPDIRHAGAIFAGAWSSEVLGDYCAGPNHVLPTARTARFSSPLGVYDFQKKSSIIACSPEGARTLGRTAVVLAEGEGLQAHAESARLRVNAN